MRHAMLAAGTFLILISVVGISRIPAKIDELSVGKILYTTGKISPTSALSGNRESGGNVSGTEAACVNCHRPSGLGMAEGQYVIPPITARYLFEPGILITSTEEYHHPEPAPTGRPAYTDATLAQAIRKGVDPSGRKLNVLMPRFQLDDATMASLIAYLKTLSVGPVPGVTDSILHFATIITPDADPKQKEGMLSVLTHFFATENRYYRGASPPLLSSWRLKYRVQRRWELHIWELTGPEDTWKDQLQERLRQEPVFAVISGLGSRKWTPVHQFCQEASLPCLFPNVDLPVVAENDFYDVYFSKGVLLEAELIAHRLQENKAVSERQRVIQIYRKSDIGVPAATDLKKMLAAEGRTTKEIVLAEGRVPGDIDAALADIRSNDVLVLWLRPDDLRNLPAFPKENPQVFTSGLMGGLERAPLAGEWRQSVLMTYPMELPQKRGVLMDYPLGWFRIERIPLVAERTQIDTYVACGILSETLKHMLDNFVRDYLVEQTENMLSSRIINGNYNRLGLAPGQRFASKGGYLVRFSNDAKKPLISEGSWIVP